ncbi:HWE histidine kinase domain-containing protein [Sphingomonas sp.]|uniref:HWE histidine kinase domain-containing protein n=1 Tax=Sphingomonas sp. TaxID=28214 RepID=UPI00185A6D58|nr:HWE histidine kinase domain-containing protein [Sphingomonas sp.]MBA3512741.1 PAS domain-containing protein [Sphingomonas sp.]
MPDKSKEQRAAEGQVESLRREGGPFVVAAEETRMPMVFMDATETGNPIIFANDSFLTLTGYSRDEVLAHSFNFLMAQGADAKALAAVEAAFGGSHEHSSEVRYRRKDGSEFWAALFISPVRDEKSGDVIQHFASFIDLTRHKEEQVQSRMLIDELNHRVKNTLTTVQSIVAQALRNATDPEIIQEAIESRLFALSRSHDLLTRENWESAGLHDVVRPALEPFGIAKGRAERIRIEGENVRFSPKAALALGIAFHELATNAAKYGAFSGETGCVRVEWTIKPAPEGDRLVLRWTEENGPPVRPSSKKGFGSRVIERGLALELGGTTQLDFRPDGVVCTIDIPAPQPAGDG